MAAGLRRAASDRGGRAALLAASLAIIAGLGGAGWRVAEARSAAEVSLPSSTHYRSVERRAPRLGLLNQHGQRITLERLAGRPVLVTFAFGHCETVCPLVVANALEAQRRLGEVAPEVVVISLDPWRDTPRRLLNIADRWGMGVGSHLLSGEVEAVNAVLDSWEVARTRRPSDGNIVHPALVYVLDGEGVIRYALSGDVELIIQLARRLS